MSFDHSVGEDGCSLPSSNNPPPKKKNTPGFWPELFQIAYFSIGLKLEKRDPFAIKNLFGLAQHFREFGRQIEQRKRFIAERAIDRADK